MVVWGDVCLEVLVDVIVIIIIHVCVCVSHTHTHTHIDNKDDVLLLFDFYNFYWVNFYIVQKNDLFIN